MPTAKFFYPDSTAPTDTLEFPEGGRRWGDAETLDLNRDVEEDADGDFSTLERGRELSDIPYTVVVRHTSPAGDAHQTDLADLKRWLILYGARVKFDWRDTDGTVRRVKIRSTTYTFVRHGLTLPDHAPTVRTTLHLRIFDQ